MDPSGPPREDESQEIRPSGGEAQQPLQSVPPAPPSQLTRFQSLPLEIQMAIFKEALRKPSVQFLMVEKQISQQRNWDVKITPVPKRSDPSGYRYLEGLKTVCDAAKAAVRWATIESKSIQFRHLPNTVDTATDLFVMEFRRYRDQPWEVMRLRDCFWNPLHEVIRPFLHRGNVRRKFHGMRRAGVTYKYSHTSSSYLHATVPFKCLLGHTANNGSCLTSYKICPVELAGFIDCLPDLETFYIIMFVVDFQRSLIDADIPASGQRPQNSKREVFYDSKDTYVEAVRSDGNNVVVGEVYQILDKAMGYLKTGNRWRMPLDQRRSIQTKVLLHIPGK